MNAKKDCEFDDVLIAVHGIGSQRRSETVRAVANRFATSEAMQPGGFAPQPLGYFFSDPKAASKVFPLDRMGSDPKLGFTEVFWADVPRRVVKEEETTEEIKEWGRSIVARARAAFRTSQKAAQLRYEAAQQALADLSKTEHSGEDMRRHRAQLANARSELIGPDFGLAAEVVEEIVDTIQVLENLSWLARQAFNFRFELQEVLEDYVGDVQIVAEFSPLRMEILVKFYKVMEDIAAAVDKSCKKPPRLHIVAHSEGTVIAFLALLHALSGYVYREKDETHPAPWLECTDTPPAWLQYVCGFLTIGSPIDKHLLLWPDLTAGLDLSKGASLFAERKKIRWRNYYDFGDPVGFKLETARRFLQNHNDYAFEFCGCDKCRHDIGFARYILPGKAHNDYWDDPEVFEHYIRAVVKGWEVEPPVMVNAGSWGEFLHLLNSACREFSSYAHQWVARMFPRKIPPAQPQAVKVALIPRTKLAARYVGVTLPYLLCGLLLLSGSYLLCKAVTNFVHPEMELLQRYVAYRITGKVAPQTAMQGWDLLGCSVGLAALLAGVTVAARLPRLALHTWKRGALVWLLGAAVYWIAVNEKHRENIGRFLADAVAEMLASLHLKTYFLEFVASTGPVGDCLLENKGTLCTLLLSLLVVLIGLTATMRTRRWGLAGIMERKQRWFRKGTRPLMLTGMAAVAIFVTAQITRNDLETGSVSPLLKKELAEGKVIEAKDFVADDQAKLLTVRPQVWPLVVSSMAFFYLWWLATMIFDLAFVWNRYVRGGVALERLRDWRDLRMKAGASESEKCVLLARSQVQDA